MDSIKVGVIGAGRMGNAFALNLLKAGHQVYVYDIDSKATENQVDVGGTALRIELDVLFNSGEVWVDIPETSCVLFPTEGGDLS